MRLLRSRPRPLPRPWLRLFPISLVPVLLLLAIPVASARADDGCYEAASTQSALNRCAGAELDAAEEALGQLLESYSARLEPGQQRMLKDVQLHWQWFRDASCGFEAGGVAGGSAYRMVLTQCRASRTRSRVAELQALARCQEGDLACPDW